MQYFEQDDYNRPTLIDEILAEKERNKPKIKTYTQDEVINMLIELRQKASKCPFKECKGNKCEFTEDCMNHGEYIYNVFQEEINELKGK